MKPINWIQWLTLGLVVAFAGLLVFGINLNSLSIRSIQQNHLNTNTTIRTLLCFFEEDALRSPHVSAEQKQHTIVVFAHALALIDEPACIKETP